VANGAVVLLSHPSLTGINSGSGISGSTGWHNSVRARMYLRGIKAAEDEQPDSDLREIEFKKNNYGPKGQSIVLRYQNGLFLPEPGMSSLEKAQRDKRIEEVFLTLLRKLDNQHRPVSPSSSAHTMPRRLRWNGGRQGVQQKGLCRGNGAAARSQGHPCREVRPTGQAAAVPRRRSIPRNTIMTGIRHDPRFHRRVL
jgi:hypothetical protein